MCATLLLLTSVVYGEAQSTNTLGPTELRLGDSAHSVWIGEVGNGFQSSAQSIAVEAGASCGVPSFGGHLRHDLALASVSYGHMLGGLQGEGHWYQGNWELRLELFGGSQFWPQQDWVVGLTPHIRYDFAVGTRLVPFFEIGGGVSGTGIGAPDLSGTFEFNLQGGPGVDWFLEKDLALTVEARYLHLSCAGLTSPNLGLNTVVGFVGVTYFF